MADERTLLASLIVAIFVVGAVTVLMHERHYQSRRELLLKARVEALEKIITEDRGS